jgi:hypothetical protein
MRPSRSGQSPTDTQRRQAVRRTEGVDYSDDRELAGGCSSSSDGGESPWRREAVRFGACAYDKCYAEQEHYDAENAAVLRHQEVSGGG